MPLTQRFSLQRLFQDFCGELARSNRLTRAGIARANWSAQEFTIIATWNAAGDSAPPGRRFVLPGSIGEWVLTHQRTFVGTGLDDVRTFPTALIDFEQEQLQANFVAPIDHGRGTVFFALSDNANRFDSKQLNDALPYLQHLYQFCQNTAALTSFEAALSSELAGAFERIAHSHGRLPTHAEVEQAYLRYALTARNGRIDGPAGAAKIAGLKPGTFRYRSRNQRRGNL